MEAGRNSGLAQEPRSDAAPGTSARDGSDIAPELSTRATSAYFLHFERVFGRARLLEALARIGGEPTVEYLLDPENFISLGYLKRAARVLCEEAQDPQFLRRAGEHQFDNPRMLGFAFYMVRSLGSPKLYYRMAVKIAPTFNRAGEVSLEALSNQRAVLRYRSHTPEGERFICEGRIGQLAAAPRLWGLPIAEARELECQVLGAEACRYELTWTPRFRPWLRSAAGGALGAAVGALAFGPRAAVVGGAIGGLAALAAAYRAAALATKREILDSAEASGRSMGELQRRFEEVQRLHAETATAHRSLSDEMQRRERAEAALVEAQKLEAVARLSGGIAHDFNNMLTVIIGSTEAAKKGITSPLEVVEHLDAIELAARRAADLTRRLLAFARRQIVEPRVLDSGEHLRQSVPMLRGLVGEDIEVLLDIAREPLNVVMDPTQMEQVLMNLAANARDAMPRGGRLRFATRAVTLPDPSGRSEVLAAVRPGEYVALTVSDNGHGMDEATRARAFEPFYTTKEAGKGTGLGLATCYGIIHQAGGAIAIDSTPGRGTDVQIYLPRAREAPQTAPARVRRAAQAGSETILVVEDNAPVRQILVRVLTGAGYRVIEAASGPEGIAAADAHPGEIQLLISDVVMPGMDGRALSEALHAKRPQIRTLFVSGYSTEIISTRGVLTGGTHLLRKPFMGEALLAKVRAVLDEAP